ncbi:MAG: recombination protein RecR [Selenomonadaceae bacterium]|nr:recombination protein RecR [Selenomonadaceae bacterium]
MAALIDSLQKLPGIGHKSATRLAYHIVGLSDNDVNLLADTIRNIKQNTRPCSICFRTIDANQDVCDICASTERDSSMICVVKDTRDLDALERVGFYKGKYHVTGGLISPLSGVTQEDIRLKELIGRVAAEDVKEIIIAFEPTVEGDATALFISRLLTPAGVKVTKLARGLPIGTDFHSTDSLTIVKAIENRTLV